MRVCVCVWGGGGGWKGINFISSGLLLGNNYRKGIIIICSRPVELAYLPGVDQYQTFPAASTQPKASKWH